MSLREWAPRLAAAVVLLALIAILHSASAHAAPNPFAVAGNEGSVTPTGIGGWLLSWQSYFYKLITGTVRQAKANGTAVWVLAGISFLYGVFHAAGPGHGKAVVTSYMLANERALRQGIAISFFAALFQGLIAIAIVTAAALALGATAQRITEASNIVETAGYSAVIVLGSWLLWTKGRRFLIALGERQGPEGASDRHAAVPASLGAAVAQGPRAGPAPEAPAHAHGHEHDHGHDAHCGHFHALDPASLGERFSWRTAILTVFSAGARPCSGAVLVLVFTRAQGLYLAGVLSTFAMAFGTAITTAGLAICAVLSKGLATRLIGGSGRRELIARGVEVLAAAAVLIVGIGLLTGLWIGGA